MKKILFSLLMLCSMTVAWAQDDAFINVATTKQLWDAIKADARAKVRITADFALSDINKDGETFCSTFYGTIDGNGHTIKGDPKADIRSRTYMFSMTDGATIKNLTFKGIRVNSNDDPNQAVITHKAQNGCVFENIMFDNVHTWSDYDNASSVAGWARDCTFTNITVKNSDFTTDESQTGAVVGHAIGCSFTNIKVENCESTSSAQPAKWAYGKSGGVVGRSDNCKFNNVEILGCFIKTVDYYAGGVAGYSTKSRYTNCTIDDQSCVSTDRINEVTSGPEGYAGGIVGWSETDSIYNCINSALITSNASYIGGIVGKSSFAGVIDGCLNTGLIISIELDDVKGGFYNKYKNKTDMTCVTKTYQGKEYAIRIYNGENTGYNCFGGIAGYIKRSDVSKCVNFGSVHANADEVSSTSTNAGIVGYLEGGTISDCFSDFSACEKVNGICGASKGYSTIKNCLNMTTYKDFAANEDNWEGFSGENNYSLTTSTNARYTTKTKAAKIKYGEICLKLGENWEQNLGTDAYPTPTGNKGLRHTRTVSDQYGAICLPFAMNSDDNVKFYLPTKVNNGEDEVTIRFSYVERLQAGYPALFKVANQGDYTFTPASVSDEISDQPFSIVPDLEADWLLRGTYEEIVFEGAVAKERYYLSDDKKICNASKVTIEPYRCYFLGPDVTTLINSSNQTKEIRFEIEGEGGETTALELVGDDLKPMQNGKAYSIMGTEVGNGYRGIVIENGKKVVRR